MLSTSMLPSRLPDRYILVSLVVTVSDVNTDTQSTSIYETAYRIKRVATPLLHNRQAPCSNVNPVTLWADVVAGFFTTRRCKFHSSSFPKSVECAHFYVAITQQQQAVIHRLFTRFRDAFKLTSLNRDRNLTSNMSVMQANSGRILALVVRILTTCTNEMLHHHHYHH